MFAYVFILSMLIPNSNVDASSNPYCKLSCGNITHACCKFENSNPGPKCKSPYNYYPMSSDDRARVLMMHNAIRNNIASGTDPFLPHPSSNMQVLMYDLELEFLASCWSTQCRKKRYGCLDSRKGETAHHVWQEKEAKVGRTTGKKVLTNSLHVFYKQLETMNRESIGYFRSENLSSPLSLLSQVLWANTQYVGCSRVSFGGDQKRLRIVNVVCVYYPKGNIDFQSIYKIGRPCSECPEGAHCHENYTSLCTPYMKRSLDTFKPPFEMSSLGYSPKPNEMHLTLLIIALIPYM
ncbi:hypothetical protein Trydic_g14497 [Trypoxylus dichotomus]